MARIGVSCVQYHSGNTSDYVIRALSQLGHEVRRVPSEELQSVIDTFEYIICVDSGEPFHFSSILKEEKKYPNLGMWYIDFRHNKHRRSPTDFENVKVLQERGAKIFQAQKEDHEFCISEGISSSKWIPLAADPEIWKPYPNIQKKFHFSFVGNVWDEARARVLTKLSSKFSIAFPAPGKAWLEQGAQVLANAYVGFNVPSYFGTAYAYDLNMRFFETLSSGLPIFTNYVSSLNSLTDLPVEAIHLYKNEEELLEQAEICLKNQKFLQSGKIAREWILSGNTYVDRVRTMIQFLE